jgi:tetratricopeptide (TPR) repeat protein
LSIIGLTYVFFKTDNVKGLFRRAKCHQSVGNYQEARDDFKEALRLDPTLKASVAKLVEQMIAEQRRIDELDKTKFQKIFNDDD